MSLNKIIVNEEVFFSKIWLIWCIMTFFVLGGLMVEKWKVLMICVMWEELATRFDLNKLTPTVPEGLWSLLWKSFEGQNNFLNFLFSVQLV